MSDELVKVAALGVGCFCIALMLLPSLAARVRGTLSNVRVPDLPRIDLSGYQLDADTLAREGFASCQNVDRVLAHNGMSAEERRKLLAPVYGALPSYRDAPPTLENLVAAGAGRATLVNAAGVPKT